MDSEPLKTEVLFPQCYEAGCTLKGSANPVFLNQAGFRDPGFMNRHDFGRGALLHVGGRRNEARLLQLGLTKKERGRVRRCDCFRMLLLIADRSGIIRMVQEKFSLPVVLMTDGQFLGSLPVDTYVHVDAPEEDLVFALKVLVENEARAAAS